ncbi:hypothetical protein C0995_010029 [Termitomyces sp. Mi166|nr:hypothetical protein C0995_010029 [Termitomyces sp. Mi166\
MFKFIALGLLMATSLLPFTAGFCGSIADPDAVAAAQERLSARSINSTEAFTSPSILFYDENNRRDGDVRTGVIEEQIKIMNSYFEPMGLNFTLISISRIPVSKDVLHSVEYRSQNERQIKSYRDSRSTAKTLNIYTVGSNTYSKRIGWSSFPWAYEDNPMDDGIVFNYNNLPYGAAVGFNTGKTMVHEVGHWVGLLHTFEGGCDGGDGVDDTPAEASPAFGCQIGRDTCPALGADPIDNLMDYSDEDCQTHFTPGQFKRASQMLQQYRGMDMY